LKSERILLAFPEVFVRRKWKVFWMICRSVFTRSLVLSFALFAAAPMAKADENWDAAKRAFEICFENFPDTRTIHDTLKAEGWRYEGNLQGFKLFSRNGYRAVAATQASTQQPPLCMVSSSRLTGDAALAYAETFVKKLEDAKPADPATHSAMMAYDGRLRGIDLRLGAVEKVDFGEMRGAAILIGNF
jgi:hypothetical protein